MRSTATCSASSANLTVVVFDPSAFGQPEARPNSAPIAFRVDDLAAARDRLVAKGVSFMVELRDSGVCYPAIFTDPDGNPLALHHRYTPEVPT